MISVRFEASFIRTALHQENLHSKLCWPNNFCVNLMANSKDLHKICVAVRTA